MTYTTPELAKLSGVTNRALRHYDAIGLLVPSGRNAAGVRTYGRAQLERLQQIRFYQQLGIPLMEIKTLLQGTQERIQASIRNHLTILEQQRNQLETLIQTVKRTLEDKEHMKDDELFHGLKQKIVQENETTYGKEIRAKYGDATIEDANRKMMKLSKAQMDEQTKWAEAILTALKEAVGTKTPDSPQGLEIAKMHKTWLLYFWPKYDKMGHLGLAQMYVDDPRFTAYYDQAKVGAAIFLRDAISAYVKTIE
jgi:DNA-binding transcriptional MerR regulator